MSNRWRTPIGLFLALAVVALGLGVAQASNAAGHGVVTLLFQGRHSQASPVASPTAGAGGQPTTQSLRPIGGTVTVTCDNGAVTVTNPTPNAGFNVEQELKAENAEVEVKFESGAHESRLEVICAGDEIQVDKLREEAVEEPVQPVPPAPATPPAPASSTRTFNLVGGTVTVTCTGNTLTVNSAVPNAGFSFEQELHDGGTVAEFRFENDMHRSRLEVGCSGGQVMVEELREESRGFEARTSR